MSSLVTWCTGSGCSPWRPRPTSEGCPKPAHCRSARPHGTADERGARGTRRRTEEDDPGHLRGPRGRHRFARGPGGAADQADQRPDRTPQDAQARPPLPPGAAAPGRTTPAAAEVPGVGRRRALPVPDRAHRPPPRTTAGRTTTVVRAGTLNSTAAPTATDLPVLGSGPREIIPWASIEDRLGARIAPARCGIPSQRRCPNS
jgi:hypothetical protein